MQDFWWSHGSVVLIVWHLVIRVGQLSRRMNKGHDYFVVICGLICMIGNERGVF